MAIEQSTPAASAALFDGDAVVAEAVWREERKREQQVFTRLPELLASAGRSVADIGRYVVGLGPGSFSGIRIAISAASAMALPSRRPVSGISSAEALAAARLADRACVAVVGDARRKRLWLAVYEAAGDGSLPREQTSLQLVERQALRQRLPDGCLVVSPDYDRLHELLGALDDGVKLHTGTLTPHAREVGQLALLRGPAVSKSPDADGPPPPPVPLYLHPATTTAPR